MHQLSILIKCYPLSLNVCLLLNCRINLPEVCPSKRSKHTSLELNIHSSALSSWFLNPLKYLKISVKHPPVGHSKGNLCKPVLKLVPLEKFCWKSSHKCWFNELIFFFFFRAVATDMEMFFGRWRTQICGTLSGHARPAKYACSQPWWSWHTHTHTQGHLRMSRHTSRQLRAVWSNCTTEGKMWKWCLDPFVKRPKHLLFKLTSRVTWCSTAPRHMDPQRETCKVSPQHCVREPVCWRWEK